MMAVGALGIGIVVASLGASGGALYLLQYLYRQREKSGASWFMGNIASVAVFCLSYGTGLLVFEPTLRITLEVVSFVCVGFMGPFFLAFGLDYTGRGNLIRTPLFGIVAAVPLLTTVFAATNSLHYLVWTDLRFEPVFGLATVAYTIQPWGIFALLFSIGTAAVGSLLLIGAILSYGPLYRSEATAVILSTAPPSVGVFVWMFELGPIPQLHLTAPLMLIHVTLDAYAFVGTHMFTTNPATQRIAEQTGLNSLPEPVLILDMEEQVVRVNDQAKDVFPTVQSHPFPVPLKEALGVTLEGLRDAGEITTDGSTFAISDTTLTDRSGDPVGRMLVLYDVTDERQREQQLAVLNRVLRHNLRNEMTVIGGNAGLLESAIDDPQQSSQASTIEGASNRLLSIAEKVREFERVQQREKQLESPVVSTVLADVEQTFSDAHGDASIEWTVTPSNLQFRTDPELLSMLLENLVENAIVHSEATEQRVSISVFETPDTDGNIMFEIRDTNDRIPQQEIETLRAGDETALQHGQGIGLWLVYWCIQKLNGTIDFEYDDGNIITVSLPRPS